jgi:hypothetical protein
MERKRSGIGEGKSVRCARSLTSPIHLRTVASVDGSPSSPVEATGEDIVHIPPVVSRPLFDVCCRVHKLC